MKDLENIKKIEKEILNGGVKPLYFFCGEESYYGDRLTNFIAANVLSQEQRDFNQTIFYGKEHTPEEIMVCAKQFPMMSEHRVVIVKEAQELSRVIQKFLVYFENPVPSTILVINYKGKTLDARTKLAKAVKKNAVYLEHKKIYDHQISSWIKAVLKEKGREIDIKAAQMLGDFLGADLSRIINELEKIFLVVEKNHLIKDHHIEENIGISKEFNNFELQKAIETKVAEKAFKIAHYFTQNPKRHPLVLTISLINSFFTKLFIYHGLRDKSASSVASKLKISPYFVKDYQSAAQHYPIRKVSNALAEIRKLDLQSKGVGVGQSAQHGILKTFLFKIFA